MEEQAQRVVVSSKESGEDFRHHFCSQGSWFEAGSLCRLTDILLEELPMKYCARQCGRKTGLERMVEYPTTPSSQKTAGLREDLGDFTC